MLQWLVHWWSTHLYELTNLALLQNSTDVSSTTTTPARTLTWSLLKQNKKLLLASRKKSVRRPEGKVWSHPILCIRLISNVSKVKKIFFYIIHVFIHKATQHSCWLSFYRYENTFNPKHWSLLYKIFWGYKQNVNISRVINKSCCFSSQLFVWNNKKAYYENNGKLLHMFKSQANYSVVNLKMLIFQLRLSEVRYGSLKAAASNHRDNFALSCNPVQTGHGNLFLNLYIMTCHLSCLEFYSICTSSLFVHRQNFP